MYTFGSRAVEIPRFVEGVYETDKVNSSDVDISVKMVARGCCTFVKKSTSRWSLKIFWGLTR
jgi:hypothetical protein